MDDLSSFASIRPASSPDQRRQRRLRWALLTLGPFCVVLGAVYCYLGSERYVSTKNAHVQADKVLISPEVAGRIVDVRVEDNDPVRKGDLMFRIDPTDFEIRLAEADARLEAVRSEIEKLKFLRRQKLRELELGRLSVELTERDFDRYKQLLSRNIVPSSNYDVARHAYDGAMHRIRILEEELRQTEAELAGKPDMPTAAHPRYRAAAAARDLVERSLKRTRVTAPLSGIVNQRPRIGQYVEPGDATMVVVATSDFWIEANFKETDLARIRPGLKVDLRVDAYPGHRLEGVVESIAQATGATFSLLPPQNATGNWIKVVQRVPVRIAILPYEEMFALRVGMSVEARIELGDEGITTDRLRH